MKATRNLSKNQRKLVKTLLRRAKTSGLKLTTGTSSAIVGPDGKLVAYSNSEGCAVDAGVVGMRQSASMRKDPSNMKLFARRYKTSQTFAMGVSDGFEGYTTNSTAKGLAFQWQGYGHWTESKPTGTKRDYLSGVNVGRAVRAAVAV